MDKKYLHHLWSKYIKPIHPFYLGLAFVASATVCVFALRANNLGMVERRQAVYEADEKGGDVEAALHELREHVLGHMNTRVASGQTPVYPPIQLKYTYQRLVEAEQKRLSEANAKVYTDAQAHCEQLYPDSFSGGPRVPCIQEYVDSHGVKAQKIPDSLYKFDFISPRWSPDLAGWTFLLSIITGAALIFRIFLAMLVRRFL